MAALIVINLQDWSSLQLAVLILKSHVPVIGLSLKPLKLLVSVLCIQKSECPD